MGDEEGSWTTVHSKSTKQQPQARSLKERQEPVQDSNDYASTRDKKGKSPQDKSEATGHRDLAAKSDKFSVDVPRHVSLLIGKPVVRHTHAAHDKPPPTGGLLFLPNIKDVLKEQRAKVQEDFSFEQDDWPKMGEAVEEGASVSSGNTWSTVVKKEPQVKPLLLKPPVGCFKCYCEMYCSSHC